MRKLIRKLLNRAGYEIARLEDISMDISIDKWVHKLDIKTILDIGSNEGQFAKSINLILPGRKIISFEPIPSVYEKLVANTKALNIKTINMALGDANGTSEINVSRNFESSSLLNMEAVHKKVYPESEYVRKETIKTGRLDDVISPSDIEGNALMKIDVQGYENKVVAGGPRTIQSMAAVIIEFSFEPIYEGQWLFDETYKYFTGNGFRFIGMASQVSNKVIGIPLYGDAIFVRQDLAKQLYS